MKLTHVRLTTPDVAGLTAFYRDALGLPVTLQTAEGIYAELQAGETILGVYERDLMDGITGASDGPAGDRVVLCFAVEDVDEAFRAAVDGGASPVTEPHLREAWFLRVAHVRDPEGNLIELNKSTYEGP